MTHANRKRVRSAEDESSEFTPLSKRINNLHINGFGKMSNDEPLKNEWTNGNNNIAQSQNNFEPSQSSSSCDAYPTTLNNYHMHNYRPDLNANDNPYYYENNKLLYSLYVERMHRRASDL